MTFKSKKFKVIMGVLLGLILLVIIIGVTGGEELPEYEIVERDDSRDHVLLVRVVTSETDKERLKMLAEHVSEEIRDTKTFEGLNMFAAYIRIHEDSDVDDFGRLILDSRIAYRSEGLPITGLDEINKLYFNE